MSRSSKPWRVGIVLSAVLALLGLGAAGWFGYEWWQTGKNNAGPTAAARDEALRSARQLAVTLQSVDSRDPEQSVQAWQGAATGELLTKLRRDQPKYLAALKKTPSSTRTTVADAALTALDAGAGTATAIVALDESQTTTVGGRPAPPTKRKVRVKLTLNRTDVGWKVASSSLVNA